MSYITTIHYNPSLPLFLLFYKNIEKSVSSLRHGYFVAFAVKCLTCAGHNPYVCIKALPCENKGIIFFHPWCAFDAFEGHLQFQKNTSLLPCREPFIIYNEYNLLKHPKTVDNKQKDPASLRPHCLRVSSKNSVLVWGLYWSIRSIQTSVHLHILSKSNTYLIHLILYYIYISIYLSIYVDMYII